MADVRPLLLDLAARNGIAANAKMRAAGRCFWHNTGTDIPSTHIVRFKIGNEVPLCTPCWEFTQHQNDLETPETIWQAAGE